MAAPPPQPPRKRQTQGKPTKQNVTPLQVLLQMGFPKSRADKALAATGEKGPQLAADWLLAHVNDPTLDEATPREYIVYLCPTGPLLEQINSFFIDSLSKCGWNGAHNFMPHVTLCSFFKANDDRIQYLIKTLQSVVEQASKELPTTVHLEHYSSANFIGLFLAESDADILKNLAIKFVRELTEQEITVETYPKSLHITLAYQFPSQHFGILDGLARKIDPSAQALWELRLYSRESRIANHEVHKVLYSHVPREHDELELLIGDFVYIAPDDIKSSQDGWVVGTSWLTGLTGYLPMNYIAHTAESDAWTLHRSIATTLNPIDLDDSESSISSGRSRLAAVETNLPPPHMPGYLENGLSDSRRTQVYNANEMKDAATTTGLKSTISPVRSDVERRKIITVRHGERVDFTFGIWIPYCFDAKGTYFRKDLNMPKSLPNRKGGPQDYFKDCPLTEIGMHQAFTTGSAIKDSGIQLSHIFCSPSFRCLMTCHHMLKGANSLHLKINVEPGLFEWLAWYQDSMPEWLTPNEMKELGYNVDLTYKPFITGAELMDKHESSEQYYMRSFYVTQNVLKMTSATGGNILLVGHAATLDTCTRQLTGHQPRNASDLQKLVHKVPYLSLAIAEETKDRKWKVVEPPFPPLTHTGNARFDWKVLTA